MRSRIQGWTVRGVTFSKKQGMNSIRYGWWRDEDGGWEKGEEEVAGEIYLFENCRCSHQPLPFIVAVQCLVQYEIYSYIGIGDPW